MATVASQGLQDMEEKRNEKKKGKEKKRKKRKLELKSEIEIKRQTAVISFDDYVTAVWKSRVMKPLLRETPKYILTHTKLCP